MSEPKIRTESTIPTTLTIDGVEIDVRVARLNNEQFDAFAAGMAKVAGQRGNAEPTPEDLAAGQAAASLWVRESLDKYFTITAGQIEHDGVEVTSGGRLLDIYGGRSDVVPQALALIMGENSLKAAEKKTFKSVLASMSGSATELPTAGTGGALAPTADAVVPSSSAAAEDATGSLKSASSGMTVPSRSRRVRSSRSRPTSTASSGGSNGRIGS